MTLEQISPEIEYTSLNSARFFSLRNNLNLFLPGWQRNLNSPNEFSYTGEQWCPSMNEGSFATSSSNILFCSFFRLWLFRHCIGSGLSKSELLRSYPYLIIGWRRKSLRNLGQFKTPAMLGSIRAQRAFMASTDENYFVQYIRPRRASPLPI